MSTGDVSQYIRKKMSERGVGLSQLRTPVSFMRDGFDAWAESERPARGGGIEKVGSDPSSLRRDETVMRNIKQAGEDRYDEFQREVSTGGRIPAGNEEAPRAGHNMDFLEKPMLGDCPSGYKDEGLLCRHPTSMDTVAKKVTIKKGKAMPDLGKFALDQIKGQVGKFAAPILEGCEDPYKEEDLECVARKPRKLKNPFSKGKGLPEIKQEVKRTLTTQELAPVAVEKTGAGKKVNARAALVKKVMREKGLSLPSASKYVKDHGLYKA